MGLFDGATPVLYPSGTGAFEGWDEFPQYGFPQTYQFSWDAVPWIESPLSLQGGVLNPLPNIDTMDPDQRNALLNSGYDPTVASINYQPNYNSLDVARYRYDPFGGYMQYQDDQGNIGYLMGGGYGLSDKHSLKTNLPNSDLATVRTPDAFGQHPTEYWKLDYDPYGTKTNRALYKIQENVGQGWFSKNMDWLVPLVIGGSAAGLIASGVGMGAGAAGGAAGAAGGLSAIGPAQGSVLPAGLQASGAMTFPVANPYAGIELLGAGALGGSGAEMLNQLIYSDIGPAQGEILGAGLQESGAMVNPVTANPYAGITATPTNSIWDLAKKIPSMPSMPGGGTQQTGGDGGEEGMSLWSNVVNPYAYAPPSTGTPNYQAHEATPYGFEDELQKRLALIRGAW